MSHRIESVDAYLKRICRNCKKANGYCIKNEAYVGLCVENDRDELIEIWRDKQ